MNATKSNQFGRSGHLLLLPFRIPSSQLNLFNQKQTNKRFTFGLNLDVETSPPKRKLNKFSLTNRNKRKQELSRLNATQTITSRMRLVRWRGNSDANWALLLLKTLETREINGEENNDRIIVNLMKSPNPRSKRNKKNNMKMVKANQNQLSWKTREKRRCNSKRNKKLRTKRTNRTITRDTRIILNTGKTCCSTKCLRANRRKSSLSFCRLSGTL